MIEKNSYSLKLVQKVYMNDWYIVPLIVIFGSVIKLLYALPRAYDLFNSGPDANGWIPAARAFANEGFFSSEIPFQPYQPTGYPYFLSFLYKFLGKEGWVAGAQITQIILFAIGSVFLYRWVLLLFNRRIAILSLVFFNINPAWVVLAGEAMYENLFGLLLSVYIFLVVLTVGKIQQNSKATLYSILSGGVAGVLSVTHPRALPIVCLMPIAVRVLYQLRQSNLNLLLYFTFLTIPVLVFGFRNLRAEGVFTLSSATWASFTWNPFFSGCQEIGCLVSRGLADPMGFLMQGMTNIMYFLSPHTGLMQRGTWHHNISLVRFFELQGMPFYSNSFGILISSFTVFTFILGLWHLRSSWKKFSVILLPIFIFLITDFVVYGENRHRLVAYSLMLPFQTYGILGLVKRIPTLR